MSCAAAPPGRGVTSASRLPALTQAAGPNGRRARPNGRRGRSAVRRLPAPLMRGAAAALPGFPRRSGGGVWSVPEAVHCRHAPAGGGSGRDSSSARPGRSPRPVAPHPGAAVPPPGRHRRAAEQVPVAAAGGAHKGGGGERSRRQAAGGRGGCRGSGRPLRRGSGRKASTAPRPRAGRGRPGLPRRALEPLEAAGPSGLGIPPVLDAFSLPRSLPFGGDSKRRGCGVHQGLTVLCAGEVRGKGGM